MTTDLTAAQALERLVAGNHRFTTGSPEYPHQEPVRRRELAGGQHPFAVVVGCSDSRPAAELIFDQGLGDLFVVRTAGHVLGAEVLGSIDYGVDLLSCPLVVILGHESCGAVGAACEAVDQGALPAGYIGELVEHVVPSVLSARSHGPVTMDEIVAEHVSRTVDQLLDRSRGLAAGVEAGRAAVVGMRYGLASGEATIVTTRGLPEPAGH